MSERSSYPDPYSTPADLWVVPPPRQSAWFPRLDWYLNWQLSKGLTYPGLHLPMAVLEIAESYESKLPTPPQQDRDVPLLVLSHGRLPARKCLVVDGAENLKSWIGSIQKLALNLNVDSLRIFLPPKTTIEQAQKIWGTGKFTVDYSTDDEALGGHA